MDLQYISDAQGRHTAVVIPIEDWNKLTNQHQDLKDLEKPSRSLRPVGLPKNNAARFKGLLTHEEANNYHAYLKQARSEWERDI